MVQLDRKYCPWKGWETASGIVVWKLGQDMWGWAGKGGFQQRQEDLCLSQGPLGHMVQFQKEQWGCGLEPELGSGTWKMEAGRLVSLKSSWVTQWVLGQPVLQSETIYKIKTKPSEARGGGGGGRQSWVVDGCKDGGLGGSQLTGLVQSRLEGARSPDIRGQNRVL